MQYSLWPLLLSGGSLSSHPCTGGRAAIVKAPQLLATSIVQALIEIMIIISVIRSLVIIIIITCYFNCAKKNTCCSSLEKNWIVAWMGAKANNIIQQWIDELTIHWQIAFSWNSLNTIVHCICNFQKVINIVKTGVNLGNYVKPNNRGTEIFV